MKNTQLFDIFLAHNSKDKLEVRAIAQKLTQQGLKPWIDEEQIHPGDSIPTKVQDGLVQSRNFALFIGLQGFGKFPEIWELAAFIMFCSQNNNQRIIPVLLPGVKKLPEGQVFLASIRYLQFHQSINETEPLNELVQIIKKTTTSEEKSFKLSTLSNVSHDGVLTQVEDPHITQGSVTEKDKIVSDLIDKLFDALYSYKIELGIQKFKVIAHNSLFLNGEIEQRFIKNHFSPSFEVANRYKRPAQIISSKPGRTKVGLRANKEDGKEIIYLIARNDNLGGLPGEVRIFFPANNEPAKISGLSL
ncbi:toll/interleukin-1 receptor domain-containing protein [Mastigocladopsis repens]|uniref:toll/interleukin-1 receptor domain-containing protein n=1 Tax=Mastigocladopsis repens TaxID=221287 RepID=UPI0002FB9ED7|nr:toll/interleukin-1 receptor domain-containing protein [Mastigocladopsis repens]